MLLTVILLIVGMVLLVGGANAMIHGATNLATALGVSPLVIGLTLVAFGTSLPEVVVNVSAAMSGETDLAFGNIVGSCSLNIAWVLAITAMVRPIRVERTIISREIPMMLLATATFLLLSSDVVLNHADANVLARSDGLVLLLLFGVFIYYTVRGLVAMSPAARAGDAFVDEVRDQVQDGEPAGPAKFRVKDLMLTLAGLVAVVAGGRLTVQAAVAIAESMGVSQAIIGMTIVSFGTTLPELVTGVLAARRNAGDIALGNVVGSNIFNILLIGGAVATISPVSVPYGGIVDLLMLMLLTGILLPVAIRGSQVILRSEAVVLMGIYLLYFVWRIGQTARIF